MVAGQVRGRRPHGRGAVRTARRRRRLPGQRPREVRLRRAAALPDAAHRHRRDLPGPGRLRLPQQPHGDRRRLRGRPAARLPAYRPVRDPRRAPDGRIAGVDRGALPARRAGRTRARHARRLAAGPRLAAGGTGGGTAARDQAQGAREQRDGGVVRGGGAGAPGRGGRRGARGRARSRLSSGSVAAQ
ncbi:hypothetical protein SBRY_30457 [Actinacidiphila bryophytorum]|uniref:Uncharacterized protein n=1 Tax=Actinacidiphila bryophytorum TaxID=1436133 RepID=A0A9W4H119_9ACTN|nr:hypothetical protein SBRY_30457 [Actinacidiphila bryophytorum]